MSEMIEYKPTANELGTQVRELKHKRDLLREQVNSKNWYAATVAEVSILRNEIERLEKELAK